MFNLNFKTMKTLSIEKMENVEGGGSWFGCAVGILAVAAVATIAVVAVVGSGGAAVAAGAAMLSPKTAIVFGSGVALVMDNCVD